MFVATFSFAHCFCKDSFIFGKKHVRIGEFGIDARQIQSISFRQKKRVYRGTAYDKNFLGALLLLIP